MASKKSQTYIKLINELYECAALSAELDLRMSKLHDVSKLIIQERDNIF